MSLDILLRLIYNLAEPILLIVVERQPKHDTQPFINQEWLKPVDPNRTRPL